MNTLVLPKLSFAPVTPEMARAYRPFLAETPSQNNDYAFGTLYIWQDAYPVELALTATHAAVRYRDEQYGYHYMFPLGKADPIPTLLAFDRIQEAAGMPLSLVGVAKEQLPLVTAAFSGNVKIEEARDYEDYIYSAEDLATLAGKKYHAKRNHIHAFEQNHTWECLPLVPDLFPACRAILAAWEGEHEGDGLDGEEEAIRRALDLFDELGFLGAVLFADGAPVAFTLGEMSLTDTLSVHFEKTLPTCREAYPVINREFVKMARAKYPALLYVNREDDVGLPNLRAAKLAYHPVRLATKYQVLVRDL